MGDFERIFGVGSDAVDVISDLSRGGSASGFGPDAARRADPYVPNYDEDFFEVDPEGLPKARLVVFSSWQKVEAWDALNLRLDFVRTPGEEGSYEMILSGRRPREGSEARKRL